MNSFLKYFLGIQKAAILSLTGATIPGATKKQMVTDTLTHAAEAVTEMAPEHGTAAQIACATALSAMEGIYQLLKVTRVPAPAVAPVVPVVKQV